MINGLGGYGAYSQLPIQEKLTNQRSQSSDDGESSKKTNASSREELFKSLLKASSADESRPAPSGSEARQADSTAGRGQVVDLNV